MGCTHIECTADEYVFDPANMVISTPAYMIGKGIAEVNAGIEKTVNVILGMT